MRRLLLLPCALLLAAACVRTPQEASRTPEPDESTARDSTVGSAAEQDAQGAHAAAPSPQGATATGATGTAAASATDPRGQQTPASPLPNAAEPVDPVEHLRDALSARRFADAAKLLTLPELAGLPLRQFVVGYVELELGHYDVAYDELSAARTRWPELGKLILPLERRALLNSSRYTDTLPELARSSNAAELLMVAERALAEGKPQDAARWLRRAAMFSGSTRKQAELRAVRARVALANLQPFGALSDWRWLALNAPLEPASRGADALIAEHFPKTPLKARQRYSRAQKFAEAGRVEDTLRELEAMQGLADFKLSPGERLHVEGWAHYKARAYERAATLLIAAADNKSPRALFELYHAAQSLSRIGKSREAIATFDRVLRSMPSGELIERSRFALGREWLVLGEWQAALDAHADFIKRYPKSDDRVSADRERAVALFALGKHQQAADAFRALRTTAKGGDLALYQLIEAVAREHSGQLETAITLLRALERDAPLTYPGQASRSRLAALGQQVEPLAPLPNSTPALAAELPEVVRALDHLGLSDLSESALRSLEAAWLRDTAQPNRELLSCETYGQLSASRRRYVLGQARASSSGFFDRPRAGEAWLWECNYPTPYRQWVKEASERWRVSPALIYAVMRQESGFHASIESPAKARGLMQIIPPTARRIAQELEEQTFDGMLDSPRHNIRFGTYYLSKLLETFSGHPAPAVAAYNAGPHAAMRWQHAISELPVELFIARIPYNETRNYVQRVLANLRIYETLYPEHGKLEIPLSLSSTAVAQSSAMSQSEIPIDPSWY